MSKMNIKTGDTVMIMSGKDSKTGKNGKGKVGKVLAVSPKEGKVIVEGCNLVSKHVKPRKMGEPGGIVQAESAIYASKVMIVDPKSGEPTRVGYKFDASGKKVRYAKKSGQEL